MSDARPVDLSIVTSMYQSAPYLESSTRRCTAAASGWPARRTRSCSSTTARPTIRCRSRSRSATRDPHVRVIDLSRNFGHHKALMTGLAHARGELVFLIDCDLEEDPGVAAHVSRRAARDRCRRRLRRAERAQGRLVRARRPGALFFSVFNRMLDAPDSRATSSPPG